MRAIHFGSARTEPMPYETLPHAMSCRTENGVPVVGEFVDTAPILDATAYTPDYLQRHPDLAVSGVKFDLTSNEQIEEILTQGNEFVQEHLCSLDTPDPINN